MSKIFRFGEIQSALMWTIQFVFEKNQAYQDGSYLFIVEATSAIHEILSSIDDDNDGVNTKGDILSIFQEGGREARVTLAHLFSRRMLHHDRSTSCSSNDDDEGSIMVPVVVNKENSQSPSTTSNSGTDISIKVTIEPLHKDSNQQSSTSPDGIDWHFRRRRRRISPSSNSSPYILERTDVWCDETTLHLLLKVQYDAPNNLSIDKQTLEQHIQQYLSSLPKKIIPSRCDLLSHIASTVIQVRLREKLSGMNAVAFIANGSIMPRKSGASSEPMSSPPAIPFVSPESSSMTKSVTIDMGSLQPYLKLSKLCTHNISQSSSDNTTTNDNNNEVTLEGMIIPKGVTLIVGGGYHGKSTMLRTIACGVYNKQLGDGRELCVTDIGALFVRAEDGRYVNNTNVSAFISNLPTTGTNTSKFSTNEASGSTSQATNVAEAIEMGATAMLVDEDVSAANFMSRDGRMRALVMDESITPLLYRVNGLYASLGISSVVVVGGVGDWLDVPDAVIKLDKYISSDALEKARSISAQFSYGHVEYGGRGVVHRLQWEEHGTPQPRRITNSHASFFQSCLVSLLEGGNRLELVATTSEQATVGQDQQWVDDMQIDDDFCVIDMSKFEQLVGGRPYLLGCGLCVCWLLDTALQNPKWSLRKLLDAMETKMDENNGIIGIIQALGVFQNVDQSFIQSMGFAYRPRRYEVAMALTRLRGIEFEDLPNDVEKKRAAQLEEEQKRKQALADLWAQRRKGKK